MMWMLALAALALGLALMLLGLQWTLTWIFGNEEDQFPPVRTRDGLRRLPGDEG